MTFFYEMNDILIAQFPCDSKTYVSFDKTKGMNYQSQYMRMTNFHYMQRAYLRTD